MNVSIFDDFDKFNTFREHVAPHFAEDTAAPGTKYLIPSAGHCAVMAILVNMAFGGDLVSATVEGVSHWYNRINGAYVDLTGDQFGQAPVQVSTSELYPSTRERQPSELSFETKLRAKKLAERAKLDNPVFF